METVDKIKYDQTMPIYGMKMGESVWMSGLVPLTEPDRPVERIRKTHPQRYPQEMPIARSIHILEKPFFDVHIWGCLSGQI